MVLQSLKEASCNYSVHTLPFRMDSIHFTWDPRRAASNQQKHGVSFEEARSAFSDANALLINDPDHSDDEDRFILLGLSSNPRLVVVCHC